MEVTPAEIQTLESWFKLVFCLVNGDHWKEVEALIVDGDTTYRWCRELILTALRELEDSADKLLSAAISNAKDQIWKLRSIYVEEAQFPTYLIWENTFTMAFNLIRSISDLVDKLTALKIAIIAGAFIGSDKNDASSLKTKLFPVFFKLKDLSSGQAVHKYVLQTFYIFVDYLDKYDVDVGEEKTLMGERPKDGTISRWKMSDSWCFGDFGDSNGQLEYPVKVLVNKQSQFLVLEQNSIGKKTVQRIQLFDKKGRYLRTLLQRCLAGITGISDMALDNEGDVIVSLKDEHDIGRVNVYNIQGECVRVTDVVISDPKFPPFFTCVAVDNNSRIWVVEHNEMSVHVYGKNGKFLFKFGKAGRSGDICIFDNIYSLSCSELNEIYICDPFQSVQVFNSEGKFLRLFKPSGGVIPRNLIVMERGDVVYGINPDGHTLEVYSLDGTRVLRKVGGHGDELGKLWSPMGIAMTTDGRIAVAEKESHRIQLMKI